MTFGRVCVCAITTNKENENAPLIAPERERTIKIFHSPPIILFIDRQNKTQALKKTPQPTEEACSNYMHVTQRPARLS